MSHPFIPIPYTIELRIEFSDDSEVSINTHYISTWPTVPGSLYTHQVVDCYHDWWSTYRSDLWHESVGLMSIRGTVMHTSTGYRYTRQITPYLYGTRSAARLPQNCSAVIRWLTDQRGQSYQGRTYHIGLLAESVNQGFLIEQDRLTLEDTYRTLITAWPQSFMKLNVVSLRTNNAWRLSAIGTNITDVHCNEVVGTQRPRLPRAGTL